MKPPLRRMEIARCGDPGRSRGMILPAFDLGSPALRLACEAHPLGTLAAVAALTGAVSVRDTTGENADRIAALVEGAPGVFRVEGVRTPEEATRRLDAGAAEVVVESGILSSDTTWKKFPRARIRALVAVSSGSSPADVGAEKIHFVFDGAPDVAALAAFAKNRPRGFVSAEGDITLASQVAALDAAGVDARVSTPLIDGTLCLPDAVAACLRTDRTDGLWSTVVVDESGVAVGFAYSDRESLHTAMSRRVGAYRSRSRNALWIKGATSGATQELLGVALDCDRDTLRFTVRQTEPGFCHEKTWSCWGPTGGLPGLSRLLESRAASAPAGSYTHRLLNDPALLASKLREESGELIAASAANDRDEVLWEAADVIYFTLVHLAKHGIPLAEVERHLDARHWKVTRRKGDAKGA